MVFWCLYFFPPRFKRSGGMGAAPSHGPYKMKKYLYILAYKVYRGILWTLWPVVACALAACALASRFARKSVDVGLGPEPFINNVTFKKALQLYGYSAETFVNHLFFITNDFDIKFNRWPLPIGAVVMTVMALFRYRVLYIYFTGGPLGWSPYKRLEPWLYKLAGTKVLVMPYGSDVQDLSLCRNLCLKQALTRDYPLFQKNRHLFVRQQIERWSRHADYVLSGQEWVDYMHFWDRLCLGHFCVDVEATPLNEALWETIATDVIKILHAPNHSEFKGTRFFEQAVRELREEGYRIELVVVRGQPNKVILEHIQQCHIVAEQLVAGWYAVFALEGMAAGKPILCGLRKDILELYSFAGLITDPPPVIDCDFTNVKDKLRDLLDHPERMREIGLASREYARKHHSLEAIGKMFHEINAHLGLDANGTKGTPQ